MNIEEVRHGVCSVILEKERLVTSVSYAALFKFVLQHNSINCNFISLIGNK